MHDFSHQWSLLLSSVAENRTVLCTCIESGFFFSTFDIIIEKKRGWKTIIFLLSRCIDVWVMWDYEIFFIFLLIKQGVYQILPLVHEFQMDVYNFEKNENQKTELILLLFRMIKIKGGNLGLCPKTSSYFDPFSTFHQCWWRPNRCFNQPKLRS